MSGSHLALEAVVSQDGRLIARCLLRRGRYVIGQERKNEIVTDAESISAKHARLTVDDDEHFSLEDLGSANGTFVDGRAIDASTAITLESEILLGQARLSFQRGGLPAAVFRHLPEGFLRTSRYVIGKVIVEGRTSTIYEARDTVLQRSVAMKVLHRAGQMDAAQVLKFIRENQIVAQLTHSNILPVHDCGLDEEVGLFCTTRFVEGEPFAALLTGMASGDPQAPHATLHALLGIFIKVCDAVAFAHARGVVHGSLRPDAVIFGRFGEVFVDHWGFASIGQPLDEERLRLEAPDAQTRPPVSRYIAPEQAADDGKSDARTDVYALGAMLFRILTLRNFNTGETEEEIVAQALRPANSAAEALIASPPPAHVAAGLFSERLAAICARALHPQPEERFATAHDLKMEIVSVLEQTTASRERNPSWKITDFFNRR